VNSLTEPTLWGVPISLLFLYFIFYSFLGWAMETIYCSVCQRRLVARGFLLGPICPIYGAGALLMILPLSSLKENPVVFYIVATVTMSAWEYFVGWLLETTTHMKYWDYSRFKFNLKGRITLWVCLWWGVLAYVVVFHIHPRVEKLFAYIPKLWQLILAWVIFVILMADTVTTIRKLALTARLMAKLEVAKEELEAKANTAKQGIRERAGDAKEGLKDRLGDAIETRPELDEAVVRLTERYNDLLAKTERHSRRFRNRYSDMESRKFGPALSSVKEHSAKLKARLAQAKQERKQKKNA
jgi:uncharacterized membrane protein